MKIMYDSQIFNMQKYGGISRVFAEIISNSKKENIIDAKVSIVLNTNYYLSQIDYIKKKDISMNVKGMGHISRLINKLNTIKDIKKGSYDIFHPTYYDKYFLKYLKKPFVLTVHDMIHEKYIASDKKTIENKRLLIENADKIIAISNNTKKDIIEMYNVDASKIEVIYWANSLSDKTFIECPKKYILFVGSRSGYKNFELFIESITDILLEDKEIQLICAGGGKFNNNERMLLEKLNIKDKVHQMTVSDSELAYLYSKARAFVYPSIYEGFGIPILEAFEYNCPVCLSNTSCFPEIARNGGAYFDPNNKYEICEVIKKVLYNEEYREELIKNGNKIKKEFGWKKTIDKYNQVYRSLL